MTLSFIWRVTILRRSARLNPISQKAAMPAKSVRCGYLRWSRNRREGVPGRGESRADYVLKFPAKGALERNRQCAEFLKTAATGILRKKWCRRTELNCGPRPYQGRALPLSYGGWKRGLPYATAGRHGQGDSVVLNDRSESWRRHRRGVGGKKPGGATKRANGGGAAR